MESQDCFICFEACSERCECACVGLFAHSACLLRLHTEKMSTKCTVCKTPLKNLSLKRKIRKRPSREFAITVLAGTSLGVFLLSGTCFGATWNYKDQGLTVSVTFFILSALALFFFTRGAVLHGFGKVPIFVSLKGVAGDVIILEEAAYCDPGLISEVVVPLLSMSNSVLLCISTLLDSGNHYSKMFELRDAIGRPLFEQIVICLVCDDCMKTDHPEKCTHKLAEMPRWLSSTKMETVKQLLSDDPAMLLRESMGLSADGSNKAFPSADVDAFIARKRIDITNDAFFRMDAYSEHHVIVAVDPSGGGSSQFAVCSILQLANGIITLIGVDTIRTKDVRHTHALVYDHIARIRASPGLDKCTIVLSLESNLAFEAQHIIHYLTQRNLERWVALSEGAGGGLGWLTAMCFQLRDALKLGNIALYSHFVCTQMATQEAIKNIRDELVRFSIVTEPAKTLFGKVRRTYTGKLGGQNDDLAIAIQLAVTSMRCYFLSGKYSNFRCS